MVDVTVKTIRLRRGTAASWASVDPVLAAGEPGYESDTGKLKIGDGSSAYSALAYLAGGSGSGLHLADALLRA